MKYKLLLFDADGTLFDFKIAEKRAFYNTLRHIGITKDFHDYHKVYEVYNLEAWKEFEKGTISSGKLRVKRFQQFLDHFALNYDPMKVSEFYIKQLSFGTDLIDGAYELIESLSQQFDMAIITNGIADVQYPRIEESKISEYFKNKIYISEEIGYPKPDKRYFQKVCADFKEINLNEILIIGNSLYSDIKGGNNFGIDACWLNHDQITNDTDITTQFEIRNLVELNDILRV